MADRTGGLMATPPYTGKLQLEAYEAGRKAHAEGMDLEACPEYSRRSLATSWAAGWKASASASSDAARRERERERESESDAPASPSEHPHAFWPADKPMPTVYARPPIPCPACRRVLTQDGGRAALQTQGAWEGVVRFRCRSCGHRWKLAAGPRFN